MTLHVIMPDLGQTVAEGKIVRWLKKRGEKVTRGEPLLEVETDKVTMEVEASKTGYLRALLVGEGQTAAALAPIAILTDELDEAYEVPQKAPAGVLATRAEEAAPVSRDLHRAGLAERPDRRQVANPSPAKSKARGRRAKASGVTGTRPGSLIAPDDALTSSQKLGMYRRMLQCRMFEDRVYYLFLEGRLPGTIHQSQGQEASAVGVCLALKDGDMITSTHRPHAHAIARGLSINTLMAELFGKATGCCRGKGGSMHIGDCDAGMLPAIAIVGGGIPLATGYALAMTHLNQPQVVVCFFGEGATNTGTFHEAVNMGAIWSLPVIYACENNKYAASTAIEKVMKIKRVSERAAAYGIPGATVDGNDVEAVYRAAIRAVDRARNGLGPTLLEFETYRFAGHSRSDPGHYRSAEEVMVWKRRDPVSLYEARLQTEGVLKSEDLTEIKAAIEHELDEAVHFAEQSRSPEPEDCLTDVFAE